MVDSTRAKRPREYSQEIGDLLCALIVEGMTIKKICAREDMPSVVTFFKWVRENEDFHEAYMRAKSEQAEIMVQDMLEIADDGSNDWYDTDANGKTVRKLNNECVQRSKLRVETRKWAASKFKPKVYGDRIIHAGDEDAPLRTEGGELTPNEKDAINRFMKNYPDRAAGIKTTPPVKEEDNEHDDLC